MYSNIAKYNKLWKEKNIDKSIVILIGGYAGTGKSTLVKKIGKYFVNKSILPTGIIRSVLRKYIPQKHNPDLYNHTYDLYDENLVKDEFLFRENIIKRYNNQIEPIASSINEIIQFASTEKQLWIIEGNHVFPEYIENNNEVFLFEYYLKVTDEKIHKKMMCGPSHNRSLNEIQFKTARIIQDYTLQKIIENDKLVFEYNEAYEKIMKNIDSFLSKLIYESNNKKNKHFLYSEIF